MSEQGVLLQRELQTRNTRVLVKIAQMLAQCGAESRLIEQTTCRIGATLGVESVEMAILPSAIVLTTLNYGSCITTTRRVKELGINMHTLCALQRICVMCEKGLLTTADEIDARLMDIKPFHYPKPLVMLMVGLSCGAFSVLYGADWPVFLVTFLSAAIAMGVRQFLAMRHFSPLINFAVTAFIATLLSSSASLFHWGEQPYLAMATSVLLLVPGFPLVNAMLDVVKGYLTMGLARWSTATFLTISATVGIVLAMKLTGVAGWSL